MDYKKISFNNADLHLIKTDRFKSFVIDVVFKLPVTKEELPKYNFLSWILNECSYKYSSKRKLSIKLEDLYKAAFNVSSVRVGHNITFSFSIESINPDLLEDKNHLNDIVDFLFEVILHPNVKNNAFDKKIFNIVKNYIKVDIESIKENPNRMAIKNALEKMDNSSISSASTLGTIEELEIITPEELYNLYMNMLHHSYVDIFIIGNMDYQKVFEKSNAMSRLFDVINSDNRKSCIDRDENFVINKEAKKVNYYEDNSKFLQSQLVMLYNISNLTKKEKDVTTFLFNFIFGSGGLKSKLYSSVREEHGYCYQINSTYYKYDNLLRVSSSLKKNNASHAIELINKSLKEMQDGLFTEDDLNDAKMNMILALNYNKNNINSLLNNFENQILNDGISIEEKVETIATITKEDIINVAKKIKENTNYLLCEE